MQNRWIAAILIFGLIECVLLILIYLTETPVNAVGIGHPDIPRVSIGGDSTRYYLVQNYALIFQFVVLAQAHCLAALGVRPDQRDRSFHLGLFGSFALAALVWWQMTASYGQFLETDTVDFVLGFPLPTAWQVYALWLSGLSLVALYSIGFKRYVWSEREQQAFDQVLAERES